MDLDQWATIHLILLMEWNEVANDLIIYFEELL